tara:strand:- start:890 stop:1348 length:459 start_codon:yes stop_codon:yes gene_type:complete
MGYQDTQRRYAAAGESGGGAAGLSAGLSGGAALGGAVGSIFGPAGTAAGAGAGALVGGIVGYFTGKSKGEKAGAEKGRQAFLASNRKAIQKRKQAEDKGQLMALQSSTGTTGRPTYSDDAVLAQNLSNVGSGVSHDRWKSQQFGSPAVFPTT